MREQKRQFYQRRNGNNYFNRSNLGTSSCSCASSASSSDYSNDPPLHDVSKLRSNGTRRQQSTILTISAPRTPSISSGDGRISSNFSENSLDTERPPRNTFATENIMAVMDVGVSSLQVSHTGTGTSIGVNVSSVVAVACNTQVQSPDGAHRTNHQTRERAEDNASLQVLPECEVSRPPVIPSLSTTSTDPEDVPDSCNFMEVVDNHVGHPIPTGNTRFEGPMERCSSSRDAGNASSSTQRRISVVKWPFHSNTLQLVTKLGQGGMGTVYLGSSSQENGAQSSETSPEEGSTAEKQLLTCAAVKTAPSGTPLVHHLMCEYQVLRELSGISGVPDVYGVVAGETHEQLVMELLRGNNLADWIDRVQQPLPISYIVSIMKKILKILSKIHHRNIAHLDLKTENIMILDTQDKNETRSGMDHVEDIRVWIFDFGLAFGGRHGRRIDANNAYGVCGTPGYAAPEVVRFMDRDRCSPYCAEKADIWSIGIIFYVMIYNELPYSGMTFMEYRNNLLQSNASIDYGSRLESFPHVKELIMRCLSFTVSERPTAHEAIRVLDDAMETTG